MVVWQILRQRSVAIRLHSVPLSGRLVGCHTAMRTGIEGDKPISLRLIRRQQDLRTPHGGIAHGCWGAGPYRGSQGRWRPRTLAGSSSVIKDIRNVVGGVLRGPRTVSGGLGRLLAANSSRGFWGSLRSGGGEQFPVRRETKPESASDSRGSGASQGKGEKRPEERQVT